MFAFAVLMLAGLAGMVMMALPGLSHRGHLPSHGIGHLGHSGAHVGHIAHGVVHAAGSSHASAAHAVTGSSTGRGEGNLLGMIPSPRVVFSLMTLFGAFGYALAGIEHISTLFAGLLAVVPTVLVERLAVTPLWNLLFRFEGSPSTPLENLALCEATAVTAFHNGRGLVSVVHDGRVVQIRAELSASETAMPVHVGDALFIEDVDVPNERVTVSVK